MNVIELIEKLKEFPPNMRVVVEGYEGGYDDINRFKETGIIPNMNTGSNKKWYYGEHGPDYPGCDSKPTTEVALLLSHADE